MSPRVSTLRRSKIAEARCASTQPSNRRLRWSRRRRRPLERLANGQYGSQTDLVILDKLGYLPFSPCGGALPFHLLIKLYECRSVVIATHHSFSEWAQVLGDTKMTTALLDRLLTNAISLTPALTAIATKISQKKQRKSTRRPPHWPNHSRRYITNNGSNLGENTGTVLSDSQHAGCQSIMTSSVFRLRDRHKCLLPRPKSYYSSHI